MSIIDNRPIYVQIADGIKDDILGGRYVADGRLPSVREMAASTQVNINTVTRGYELLERDGIIYNKRGLGYFLSPEGPKRIIEGRKQQFRDGEMEYFFTRLAQMGVSSEELKNDYEQFLKK